MAISGYPFSNGSRLTHTSLNEICEALVYTAGEGIKIENNIISVTNGQAGQGTMIEVTYSELMSLRNNSDLIAGMLYRITDFVTTVNTDDLTVGSAGHPFDVIVLADSEATLNENVRFIQHKGDTYFSGCDLAAWEGKYSIDNNTDRFAWADATNGKGVIYYLKDEFDNECPYDFKNVVYNKYMSFKDSGGKTYINAVGDIIVKDGVSYYKYVYTTQTYRREVYITDAKPTTSSTVYNYNGGSMTVSAIVIYSVDTTVLTGVYTFSLSEDTYTDSTINKVNDVHSNTIKPYVDNNRIRQLSKIQFTGSYVFGNVFGINCHDISFADRCYSNRFGDGCAYNTFGEECYNNVFGAACCNNTFGGYAIGNIFSDDCSACYFSDACQYNTLGGYTSYITLGDECCYNSFGNSSSNNTFGYNCQANSLSNDCWGNTFGNDCSYNSFGNECHNNTFGNETYSNSLGNDCYNNIFGDDCYGNCFGNQFHDNTCTKDNGSATLLYCIFGGNNHHLDFGVNYSGKTLSNLHVSNSYKYDQKTSVPVGVTDNVTYQQNVGFNSQGQFTVKAALD